MKNIRVFLCENFQFLKVKFSIYLNRRVFVMEQLGPGGVSEVQYYIALDRSIQKVILLVSPQKQVLWVLIRSATHQGQISTFPDKHVIQKCL